MRCLLIGLVLAMSLAGTADAAPRPNLVDSIARPLRYHPDHGDFVIHNGAEFFNRSLYGGHTAFRVDGGDKPEFLLYLPGRGGNLRLGIRTAAGVMWLKDAQDITTRYRPGELIYDIRDPAFGALTLDAVAPADTEGLIVRIVAAHVTRGARLVWAFGGVTGVRGARDGDIGTEKVPISQYFQFQPSFADGNTIALTQGGFTLRSSASTLSATASQETKVYVADGGNWGKPDALFTASSGSNLHPVAAGEAPLREGRPLWLAVQKTAGPTRGDLDTYREVGATTKTAPPAPLRPAFTRAQVPAEFAAAQSHFRAIRDRVRIDTPDPYFDAAVGALNVVADALWDDDQHAIMHGAIAWRTKLLGWRGPYALDDLGWHDRARENFDTWLPKQNTAPITALPPADSKSNLARNEAGLHSHGDLSNSHYDMNLVFIDAVLRHLLWTGDTAYARQVWPQVKQHLAWEQRLFRREFGPDHLPLYEAYADIWASDDLYYSGGGTAVASAYMAYAERMAAELAPLAGEDPAPYRHEAELIDRAMHQLLWLPEGGFAESKDLLGLQRVHPDYALWSFYHPVDEAAATPDEAWRMGEALTRHLRPIPVTGPGVPKDRPYHVLSESDWMPYTWSINNVVMDENLHTALALWQGGHAEDAYVLAKGAILASQYMGISPGNVGTMNDLDVYRREAQRDFADSAGTLSRAVVEGLFGVRPDALGGTLTIAPGLPLDWTHARLHHPDIGITFTRSGRDETWTISQSGRRFRTLVLRLPMPYARVAAVTDAGHAAKWVTDPTGTPHLVITLPAGASNTVRIRWQGKAVTPAVTTDQPPLAPADDHAEAPFDWHTPVAIAEPVNLTPWFNDKVSAIFAPGKYQSPRSPYVSLALPAQGIGAWAGHLDTLPAIDDSGLRQVAAAHDGRLLMPNGLPFATPGAPGARNIAFTSRWDNYPHALTVPIDGQARTLALLMAGSTNAMQSHIDNGEVVVTYTDGTTQRLALRNPETWWPIDQDYFIDDYQFPDDAPLPPRVDLKSGRVRLLDATTFKGQGGDIPGGAATVLTLTLDPSKPLTSLTIRTLSNDVVIGLMAATLVR